MNAAESVEYGSVVVEPLSLSSLAVTTNCNAPIDTLCLSHSFFFCFFLHVFCVQQVNGPQSGTRIEELEWDKAKTETKLVKGFSPFPRFVCLVSPNSLEGISQSGKGLGTLGPNPGPLGRLKRVQRLDEMRRGSNTAGMMTGGFVFGKEGGGGQ